ncbi:helix-turn-helix domain-containing protein [Streptosporangium sp. NPDC051023]|uniref:PucR family transcriptional regulator n=1 Tax=Streptosporangium sp. NPDC051023 TaxID=3155410 RepID=UPI00344E160E
MPSSNALTAVATDLMSCATPIANEFVRRHASGVDPNTADRIAPRDTFDWALQIIKTCASALGDEEADVHYPVTRGALVALQGKPVADAVEWLRSLERLISDQLLSDPALGMDVVRRAVARVARFFDELCVHELESFESTHDELSSWCSRLGTDLLSCLVSGAPVDAATVNGQARVLNIDPHQPFRAIAVSPMQVSGPSHWAQIRRRVLDVLWRHDPHRQALIRDRNGLMLALVPTGGEGPGLIPLLTRLLEDEELSLSMYVASGEPADSLAVAGHSCRQALSALEIAIYRGQRGQVTQCTQVILEVLLAHNRWVSRRIVDTRIGSLVKKPHLLETLRVYINCDLALQRTAEELLVHPNTVAYRLRQIGALTGRDMRRITDISDLSIALTALDVVEMRRDQDEGRTDLRARLLA